MSAPEIISTKIGHCGLITLDRPKALNALTHDMVTAMAGVLDEFAGDPAIRTVAVRSTSARAFCAGADIRRVYELGKDGQHDAQRAFLRDEYRNCYRIKTYPKPYVALMDGIVMGGGAGISVNGAHRVAGDSITFAMPETAIGFFPDIGATFFLPRLADKIGTYLAMTGARIDLGDVLALGLANAHVPSARFDRLIETFADGEDAAQAIAAESVAPPPSGLLKERELISRAFAFSGAKRIFAALADAAHRGSAFAEDTLATLHARSPSSVAIALKQMQIGGALDFAEALKMEFRIAARILQSHDFYEGVRVTLVDKGDIADWRPAALDDLSTAKIDAFFAPLGDEDLTFPRDTA
ncbi:MAG: enoyl-CoA hydratase/isomerase family protein [Pseudomonadota bacterium]